jgi:hypothetical protein
VILNVKITRKYFRKKRNHLLFVSIIATKVMIILEQTNKNCFFLIKKREKREELAVCKTPVSE